MQIVQRYKTHCQRIRDLCRALTLASLCARDSQLGGVLELPGELLSNGTMWTCSSDKGNLSLI